MQQLLSCGVRGFVASFSFLSIGGFDPPTFWAAVRLPTSTPSPHLESELHILL